MTDQEKEAQERRADAIKGVYRFVQQHDTRDPDGND